MASPAVGSLTDAGTSAELSVVPLDLFASSTFNDQALFALGAASSQSAEVGEVLRIAQTINARTSNPTEPTTATFDAYCDAFSQYGDEIARRAASSGAAHAVTTRNRLMRASMYAAQDLFFVLGSSNGAREERVFEAKLEALRAAIDEGDSSGVAEGNVFVQVREALHLAVNPS